MLTILNADVLTPFEYVEQCGVVVENGRITAINSNIDQHSQGTIIDASGLYLVPGFIELQINGGFGCNFTEDPTSIWHVASKLPQYGVTAFLPTIVTSPLQTVAKAQDVLSQGRGDAERGARPLGLHAEGPFLNPKKKGAHVQAHLRAPDLAAIENWARANGVWLVTIAPELPGALSLIECLVAQDVIVSAGHTMATYQETQAGISSGIVYGTHLFNAMRPVSHRELGVVGALLQPRRFQSR